MLISKYDRGKMFSQVDYVLDDTTITINDPYSYKFRDFNDFIKNRDMLKHIVTKHEEGRPDFISFHLYGNVYLWWVVLQVNKIMDPFTELLSGTELRLPMLLDVEEFLNIQRSKRLTNRTITINDRTIG